jgi:hypothetical protein
MAMTIKEQEYNCPHCGKCIAIPQERDPGIHVAFHKERPLARPGALRTLTRRKCPHDKCREYFIVENYGCLEEILHWLIFTDTRAIAREDVFAQKPEFIRKLRQDKKFMAMINDPTND